MSGDRQMLGRQIRRIDQPIGGFAHAVMHEPVIVLGAQQQFVGDEVLQRAVDFLHGDVAELRQQAGFSVHTESGERLQHVSGAGREPVELAAHQIDNVVGEALLVDQIDVPDPLVMQQMEAHELLVDQGRKELNREEWIAARLAMDQFRQRDDMVRLGAQHVGDQRADVVCAERREADLLDMRHAAPDLRQRA